MLRNVVERSSYVQSLLTGAFDGWVSVLIYQTLGGQICSRPARKIILSTPLRHGRPIRFLFFSELLAQANSPGP